MSYTLTYISLLFQPEDEIDGDQEDEEQMTEEAEKEVKKEPVTNQVHAQFFRTIMKSATNTVIF